MGRVNTRSFLCIYLYSTANSENQLRRIGTPLFELLCALQKVRQAPTLCRVPGDTQKQKTCRTTG
jgi:hypothetical protein